MAITEKQAHEFVESIIDEPTLLAVDHFSREQKKLIRAMVDSPLIKDNPFIVNALLFTLAETILEVAILIDKNVFKCASKSHLLKIIEDLYDGKGQLESKMPKVPQFTHKQQA